VVQADLREQKNEQLKLHSRQANKGFEIQKSKSEIPTTTNNEHERQH
jgi:hypothetical protein